MEEVNELQMKGVEEINVIHPNGKYEQKTSL
jgi:hypothetical protein